MTYENDARRDPPLRSVLYATYAYLHPRKPLWRVPVQGRFYSERPASFSQKLLLHGLQRALKVRAEQTRGTCFDVRVGGFLARPEVGARVRLHWEEEVFRLRGRSKGSGLFQGRIDLPRLEANAAAIQRQLTLTTSREWGEAQGTVHLVGTTGCSVISDIDDTIKLTEVTSRGRMLNRTFLEEFEAIPGMAEVYRAWAEQGASFHYVSSSPWQIYGPLYDFLHKHGFPGGSMHLKWFRLRDEIFKRWRLMRRKSKGGVIAGMIQRMPYRKFLLVGDSGERDPEIYAKLARRFPYQIVGCLIRDLEALPVDSKRHDALRKSFGNVPLTLFREPCEIAGMLATIQRSY
jgi:phosphatidate phosphatase APP1